MKSCSVLLAALLAGAAAGPAPGQLRIVGSQASGCIAGAIELPPEGPGFQTIHRANSSFWGAPATIDRIRTLGEQVRAAGLGDFYIVDISRPRGGPLPGGHVSHQLGLDVDIGLDVGPKRGLSEAERETVEMPSMVRADRRGVDVNRWNADAVTLLRLAAGLPGVDRVLINPAIKRQLCDEVRGDRAWLRLMRPWYGHAAHMHVRFRCPSDHPECVQAAPPPPGDGCDATLQWWFDQLDVAVPAAPSPPRRPPPLPEACRAIMAAP